MDPVTGRRRPPVGLLLVVVAGSVAGVALVTSLGEPPAHTPRAGRAPAAEAAMAPSTVPVMPLSTGSRLW